MSAESFIYLIHLDFKRDLGKTFSETLWYNKLEELGVPKKHQVTLVSGAPLVGGGKLYEDILWLDGKTKEEHRLEWGEAMKSLKECLSKEGAKFP